MAYVAQPQMTVQSGGNRNAKNLPVGPHGREWSTGLCGCCDSPGTCIVATCFPCITYGKVKNRYKHLSDKGVPDPDGGGCCNGACCIYTVLSFCGVACILQMMSRGDVRGRYNIEGGGCGDCCTACWCTPCELVQEHHELQLEENSFSQHGKH